MTPPPCLDSSIRNMMMFREVFGTQTDHYQPELAPDVLATIADTYDSEVVRLVLEVTAQIAMLETNPN